MSDRPARRLFLVPPVAATPSRSTATGVDLFWIPLGAGAHLVRVSGRTYERLRARVERRPAFDLYHSTLVAATPEARYVIEMAPVPDAAGVGRGVVGEGPVGSRWLARFRVFRYEIRRWRDGVVPDLPYAVGGPVRVTADEATTRRILDLVPLVPRPVWGRDELQTGEMWNSNSVVAWLLARAGVETAAGRPPPGGRAPGWDAGMRAASRWSARHGVVAAQASTSPL